MSGIAFHFDFTGVIIGAEIVAFLLLFAGWWVRRRSVPWALAAIAGGVLLLVAAPLLAMLE